MFLQGDIVWSHHDQGDTVQVIQFLVGKKQHELYGLTSSDQSIHVWRHYCDIFQTKEEALQEQVARIQGEISREAARIRVKEREIQSARNRISGLEDHLQDVEEMLHVL